MAIKQALQIPLNQSSTIPVNTICKQPPTKEKRNTIFESVACQSFSKENSEKCHLKLLKDQNKVKLQIASFYQWRLSLLRHSNYKRSGVIKWLNTLHGICLKALFSRISDKSRLRYDRKKKKNWKKQKWKTQFRFFDDHDEESNKSSNTLHPPLFFQCGVMLMRFLELNPYSEAQQYDCGCKWTLSQFHIRNISSVCETLAIAFFSFSSFELSLDCQIRFQSFVLHLFSPWLIEWVMFAVRNVSNTSQTWRLLKMKNDEWNFFYLFSLFNFHVSQCSVWNNLAISKLKSHKA